MPRKIGLEYPGPVYPVNQLKFRPVSNPGLHQIERLWRWLFLDLSPAIAPTDFRFSIYLNFLLIFSWIAHALFIPVFAYLEVEVLVFYNIASVILLGAAWLLNRRGWGFVAMLLAAGEFVGHAWLSVRLVGWDFGFQYFVMGWSWVPDLWGDMVNTASRMESHGIPGCIQTSRRYYEQTQHLFEFERRGTIDIKGKGPMETFLLTGRRGAPPAESAPEPRPCRPAS